MTSFIASLKTSDLSLKNPSKRAVTLCRESMDILKPFYLQKKHTKPAAGKTTQFLFLPKLRSFVSKMPKLRTSMRWSAESENKEI